jgi:hypothetical protein
MCHRALVVNAAAPLSANDDIHGPKGTSSLPPRGIAFSTPACARTARWYGCVRCASCVSGIALPNSLSREGWYGLVAGRGVDWPAWVQAVGSVGAIFVAIWVARRQHNEDVRRDVAAVQDRDQRERRLAMSFAATLSKSLSDHVTAVQTQNHASYESAKGTIDVSASIGGQIDITRLPWEATYEIIALRNLAAEVRAFGRTGIATSWRDLESQYRTFLSRANTSREELARILGLNA